MITVAPLFLLVVVVSFTTSLPQQVIPRATAVYANAYSEVDLGGYNFKFTDSLTNLSVNYFEDTMDSAVITGMWVFYENVNYNTQNQDKVYWAAGIDYFFNFPEEYRNVISSMRFVGHPDILNADYWTIFDMTLYQGDSVSGIEDASSLGDMEGRASSMALIGNANWTVFTEVNFSGLSACITSGPYHYHVEDQMLTVAHIPDLVEIGVFGNAIKSIRKGC